VVTRSRDQPVYLPAVRGEGANSAAARRRAAVQQVSQAMPGLDLALKRALALAEADDGACRLRGDHAEGSKAGRIDREKVVLKHAQHDQLLAWHQRAVIRRSQVRRVTPSVFQGSPSDKAWVEFCWDMPNVWLGNSVSPAFGFILTNVLLRTLGSTNAAGIRSTGKKTMGQELQST
jgi:hypothetical protein